MSDTGEHVRNVEWHHVRNPAQNTLNLI